MKRRQLSIAVPLSLTLLALAAAAVLAVNAREVPTCKDTPSRSREPIETGVASSHRVRGLLEQAPPRSTWAERTVGASLSLDPQWVTLREVANEADAEEQRHLGTVLTAWLDAKESTGIVYLIFQSPARIERYDMTTETWLADIPLGDTPTAFAVDADGLYISFGDRTSRFDLDGTGETHLRDTSSDATSLFTVNEYLYIYFSYTLTSVNKTSGALIDSRDYWYRMQGIDVAPTIGKAFGRSVGGSPSDIVQVILNSDGTLGNQADSPYHGAYPSALKTFVFPGEARVADDSGIVYDTNDLSYSNSLAGSFDDLAFYGDQPIVLRDDTLIAHSNACLETGRYTPAEQPQKVFVKGEFIFSFYTGSQGTEVDKIPVSLLNPPEPGEPVDPHGLFYVPDSVVLGQDEMVYLLSRDNLSIFRWSVPQRTYTETIPLVEAPILMAYCGDTNRLYLAYSSGKITQIRLDDSTSEEPFANSPQTPCGLSTAGDYVFVCDPSGAWASHFTYSPEGVLISQEEWNYQSTEYIWNEVNRKMYFISVLLIPMDLLWEDIDLNGVIGAKMDSPYHSSDGMLYPIRVAPDGSVVVLGSGRIYDAISLEQIDALSNNIDDAIWGDGTLFTLRAFGNASQLQKWGSNYSVEASRRLCGDPMRMFPISEGLLVITDLAGRPSFSVWDFDLQTVWRSDQPAYLTVIKHVINDHSGTASAGDFTMTINGVAALGGASFAGAEDPGTTGEVCPGNYDVTETGPGGYSDGYSPECSGTIAPGQSKTCTVTNTELLKVHLPLVLKSFCPDFFDDFSNPASGWWVGEDPYVRAEYLNGEYRVLSKAAGYFYLFDAPTCSREDYAVELDARWSGAPGNSYGIVFGITSGFNQYYLFDMNTDFREFRLLRRDPTGWTQIVPPTYSAAINSGTASNHVKATRNGSSMTLEVNGAVLGAWSDSAISGLTGVGLVSSPYDAHPTSDARFDNFRVTDLIGTGAGAQDLTQQATGTCELRGCQTRLEPLPAQMGW